MFRAHQTVSTYREWRDAARRLLRAASAAAKRWSGRVHPRAQDLLFEPEPAGQSQRESGTVMIPRAFFAMAEPVSRHSSRAALGPAVSRCVANYERRAQSAGD